MGKPACGLYSRRRGFALAEIVVALFIVTAAIALVAGLGQQVMDLAKRSSQTGSIIELRSMVNSISRNPTTWIEKMRASVAAQGLYAGCIPDPKLNISTFACPNVDANIISKDPELAQIAGSTFHVASAPIVNNSGELIAGTLDKPIFLSNSGRLCQDNNPNNCPLKSTGYFLRSNPIYNQDPGNIKFVIKIERNSSNLNSSTTPMKPQYMTVDIGEEWKSFDALTSGTCPAGSVKVGYLSNGKPSCLSTLPNKQCPNNQFAIGTDNSGNIICKGLPTSCPANSSYVLNDAGTDLECSTSTAPCGSNNVFLGYFGGSGEPMCSGAEIKCSPGELQVGIKIADGKMSAECSALPASCTDANNKLSYDGEKFVCQSAAVAISCPANQTMSGMKSDGSPICVDIKRLPASNNNCGPGTVAASIDANGTVVCRAIVNADFRGLGACPSGYALKGVDGNGTIICEKTSQMIHVSVQHLEWVLNRDNQNPRAEGYDGTCQAIVNNPSIQFYFNSSCGRFCADNGFVRGTMVECGSTHAYCFCVN